MSSIFIVPFSWVSNFSVSIGGRHELKIFTQLAFVEDIFVSAVMEHPTLDEGTKLAVVRAVNKVGVDKFDRRLSHDLLEY